MPRREPSSRLHYFTEVALPGLLLIVLLMVGALTGVWAAPRAVILVAPHAPTAVIYGSLVVGILLGAGIGALLAEALIRFIQRFTGLTLDR
ncbi:MAG: hypothetical protein EPN72_14110 [Nevskiaceae bacterium]|nr:MAG: hypothetical protein EPN63_01975 [Nevskiaceae bacterium]TBR71331.1 MAG: hypothetical protein EPN72_14110 [Nevskiaceae bacterium]